MASLFASDTLVAILARFAAQPERSFYQRELARITGAGLFLVQRELARLESAGLVTRTPRGRQVEYAIVVTHPAWRPLRDLMLRTVALADTLATALVPLGDRVRAAWVYGSVARGDDRPDSDVDLILVGAVSLRDLAEIEMPGSDDIGRHLNIVTFSEPGFGERTADDHFVREVLDSPRIWVVGGDDDLAALVRGGTSPPPSSHPQRDTLVARRSGTRRTRRGR